jgi:hypothetical protein
MRTTLILNDETMIELKELAARQSRTLTEIVAETLNRGLRRDGAAAEPWTCESYDMGGGFDYTKAWERIDGLEASAVAEKMDARK